MKSNHRVLFVIVLSLLFAVPVLAQTHRASIRGIVYDPNHATVAGATITLTNRSTGETRTTISAEDGSYAIASIPPGEYSLRVEQTSFKTSLQSIKLLVNEQRQDDVTLQIGGPDVSVTNLDVQAESLKKESA
ncbi:MAG TPA: carboxypeptidase-like regulatory domain-containing protein [Pyrinomonadaceae bacterium]|nr:carboxypeptidase-like regulatory domain-containing protein [Pyrinomonadaceae bacterium]